MARAFLLLLPIVGMLLHLTGALDPVFGTIYLLKEHKRLRDSFREMREQAAREAELGRLNKTEQLNSTLNETKLENNSSSTNNTVHLDEPDPVLDGVVNVATGIAKDLHQVSSKIAGRVGQMVKQIAASRKRLIGSLVTRFLRLESVIRSGISHLLSGHHDLKDGIHRLGLRARKGRSLSSNWQQQQQQQISKWDDLWQPQVERNDIDWDRFGEDEFLETNDVSWEGFKEEIPAPLQPSFLPTTTTTTTTPQPPVNSNAPRDDKYVIRNGTSVVTVHVVKKGGNEMETSYSTRFVHVPSFEKSLSSPWDERSDEKFEDRRSTSEQDERAHMVSQSLGGPSKYWNLQPMARSVKHGQVARWKKLNWVTLENRIRTWVAKRNRSAEWRLDVEYGESGPRPSRFVVKVDYYKGAELYQTDGISCENLQDVDCTNYSQPGPSKTALAVQ
jgi:hypothetical protein